MKLIFFLLCFESYMSSAQLLHEYNKDRIQLDKRLMITLGSWASSNIILSGIRWATVPKDEGYYFHQMNVLWNTVNLGLAIPGYLKTIKGIPKYTLEETMKAQRKTENIFLINTVLDGVYISSGIILHRFAKTDSSNWDRFNGFGNSLILQGGFLLIFDLTAYCIHKLHSKKFLNKLEISERGIGLKWNI